MPSALVRQLLEAGVHFGHQTKRWNPKMRPFIFGARSGIYIIDLEKTAKQLERARQFVEQVVAKGDLIVFIGTKKQAKQIVEDSAKRVGMPYVTTRWLGGTLTNFNTIKRNIERMNLLRKQRDDGYLDRLSKKDQKHNERDLARLEVHFSGLANLDRKPAALFVIDPKREQNAVHEANRLGIPIVAICDTNADPDLIAYPIPGNDDAMRSIRLIAGLIVDSIATGRTQAGLPPSALKETAEAQAAESAEAAPAVAAPASAA